MNPKVTEDDLLLYWSNELEAHRVRAVEEHLECDPKAAAYLAELDGLHEAIQDVPQEGPSEPITEDTVARYQRPSKITVLPKPLRITAIAAGFAVLATTGLLVMRPWSTPQASTTAQISPEKSTGAEKAVGIAEAANEPLLSQRLFANRSPHSSNARVRAAWERAGRIRGLLAKKRTVR